MYNNNAQRRHFRIHSPNTQIHTQACNNIKHTTNISRPVHIHTIVHTHMSYTTLYTYTQTHVYVHAATHTHDTKIRQYKHRPITNNRTFCIHMLVYTCAHHNQPHPHTPHPTPYITSTYTPPQHCCHDNQPHPRHAHRIYTTPTHTQQSTLQHTHPIHPTTTYALQRIAVR